MARRKTLKLSSSQEIQRALSRVSNMLLNKEIDPKVANALVYTINSVLAVMKLNDGKQITIVENGGNGMKSNRQYDIQCLLRMAEITGDEDKRKQYLREAEKLLFKNCSKGDLEQLLEESNNSVKEQENCEL